MALQEFKHRGLKDLFVKGNTRLIGKRFHENLLMLLDFLDAIDGLEDCRGVKDFHALKGNRKGYYSMKVSGNYRQTFRHDGEDVRDLDFEDYH